jgi:hypothetical protein
MHSVYVTGGINNKNINLLKHSGNLSVPPILTEYIYGFHMILRINSGYFPEQH